MPLSRRELIALGAGSFASLPNLNLAELAGSSSAKRKAKNVIFCVADGMGMQTFSMANQFRQMADGKPSYWSWLLDQEFVVNGLQATSSLNSLVTDSSAAASAWGSGRHIWNGAVNMLADGTKLRTLFDILRAERGLRTGLVTTTTLSHATPSGFSICQLHRDDEADIALQHLSAGVDVLMGGGDRFFSSKRKDGELYGKFEARGYKVCRTRDEMLGFTGDKALGIFSDGHLPYTIDRKNDASLQASVPTLAEMATKAIAILSKAPKGFILQIEGGRVDHGAHANDLAGMIHDQLAFEDAVKVAVDFALADKNTLVIVTTDHACGGAALNGAGDEYIDSTAGLAKLAGMKSSYGPITSALGRTPTDGEVASVIEARLGIQLSKSESAGIAAAIRGASPFELADFHKAAGQTLAMILGNHTKVTWTSGNHCSDHVLVTALGPGCGSFAGITENVKFFDIMLAQYGLKWSNPSLTFDEARKHMSANARSEGPHWL